MTTPLPHEQIRGDEDRSYTFVLLARLAAPDLAEDERDEVAETLEHLDDPRAEPRLLQLLEDRASPAAVREAASVVLRACGAENQTLLPAMLRDGDLIAQRYAVLGMNRGHADLLEPIARDPEHPLHREAIETMIWGFEEPRFQALKIAALSHRDPSVRASAADALFWDEPTAAEEPLLAGLDDPNEQVVVAAANTLQYYPTRRTLARLAEVSTRDGRAGAQAKDSCDELRWRFQSDLRSVDGDEREELLAWMQPVWSILAFTDDDLVPESRDGSGPTSPVYDIVTADELVDSLSDPDRRWVDKKRRLRNADPKAFSPSEIERLAPFFAKHPDPAVREGGARLLAAWDHYDALVGLLDDPRFVVMKSAMYFLGKTRPNALVAERALRHLLDPGVTSTHAYETLATYVAHAPAEEAIVRLLELAQRDERETVRAHAVHALTKLGVARAIESLLPLLERPPLVTWAVHIALLEAARELGLTVRGLDVLRDIDNLDLQKAIARFGHSRSL